MRLVKRSVLVLTCLGVLLGCTEQLPEYYGVYINTSGDFKDIRDAEPEERLLSDNTSILVFDKAVSNPGFDAQDYLSIKPAKMIRYEIESDEARPANFDELRFHHVLSLRIAGPAISLRSKPLPGQSEMVQFEPVGPFSPGRYALTVGDSLYLLVYGESAVNTYSPNNQSCIDRRTWTRNIDKQFSWDAFRNLAQGGLSGSTRSASGNVIMRSEEWPCQQSEEVIQAARERVRLPSYVVEPARSALLDWLLTQPSFRLAEPADCACDEDLVAMRDSYENDNPYYVMEDFNADGELDLAVIVIDSEAHHEWGWDAALAIFNGPLGSPASSPW